MIDDHLYSAILRSLEQTHCARLWFYMSDKPFIARFLNIHRSGVLTALARLVPHETAAVSAQVLCTPYNHASCHFMQSRIRKVYAWVAVTFHLHFWQNGRGVLRATAEWCTYSAGMAGATRICCRLGAFCVHHTTVHHVTSCKATYVRCMRVLAVTCHLHFWQNDRDFLRATAVTRGWNGYRNKSRRVRDSLITQQANLTRNPNNHLLFWASLNEVTIITTAVICIARHFSDKDENSTLNYKPIKMYRPLAENVIYVDI